MRVGFIGLGKLGMPCAVAMQMKGHDVMGYDINSSLMNNKPRSYLEAGPDKTGNFNHWMFKHPIKFGSVREVVLHSEIIFLAVQTPHLRRYEGTTRIPKERVDFDYSYLEAAVKNLSEEIYSCRWIEDTGKNKTVVIISTVLPGTFRKRLLPLTENVNSMKLCYNPFFIAMGTTMWDYLNPEFILFGVHDEEAANKVEEFYKTITDAPFYKTGVENAELIKVAYNTFIGTKIAYVNALMEICHKLPGCDVDEVTNALKLATGRLISPAYMTGGMGDGGGCHPRDNIALSWLAQELNLSYDFFESMMAARENQTEWMADLIEEQMDKHKIDRVVIMGYSFKPESNITVGSPALLLELMLRERAIVPEMWDPEVDAYPGLEGIMCGEEYKTPPEGKAIYFIGTKHEEFRKREFTRDSVVIDPFRYIEDSQGDDITYIKVGGNGTV